METKVLQVFYGKDCLPYKDKERAVHFPIIGAAIQGASNTTKIRFYFDQLVEEDDETTTWVVVSKLPNGKIGSEIVETQFDEELNERYVLFNLNNFYTQEKGDLFLSLQGYQGGVQVETDPETNISQIYGTPTIQATGSIKLAIKYATQLIGSGETSNITLQKILAELGTKLGIREYTVRVDELPLVGETNVFYAIYDDPSNPNKLNIYIWNATTQSYVWVGDNTLNLGDYYTQEQGEQFESGIDNRVTSVENELSSVASGSPKGVYATLSDLESAYPTGTDGIYVVSANGHWYYWNGTQWADGGEYLSNDIFVEITEPQDFDDLWSFGKYAFSSTALFGSSNIPQLITIYGNTEIMGAVLYVERTTYSASFSRQKLVWGAGQVWYRYRYSDGISTQTTPWLSDVDNIIRNNGAKVYTDTVATTRNLNDFGFGVYILNVLASSNLTNAPAEVSENSGAIVKVERVSPDGGVKLQTITYFATGLTYRRTYYGNAWSIWYSTTKDMASFNGATIYNDSTNVSRDLNSFGAGYYLFNGIARTNLLNQPANNGVTSLGCSLKVERTTVGSWDNYVCQKLYYPQTNKTYMRSKNVSTWSNWVEISTLTKAQSIQANASLDSITEYINAEDAVDLDNLDFGVYALATNALQNSTNLPTTFTEVGGAIVKVERDSYSTSGYKKQTLIYSRGDVWERYQFNNVWSIWKKQISEEDVTGIPNYWKDEIKDTVDKVFSAYSNKENTNYCDTFLFITDTHWGQNAKHSPAIINRLCKDLGINFLMHGGDFITYEDSKLKAYNQLNDFFKKLDISIDVMPTIGNHDLNDVVYPSAALTRNQLYGVLFKRCEKFTNTNKEYRFYYDNESQKIRYITLRGIEGEEWSAAQKTFITNAVSSLSSEWTVVILCHSYWQPNTSGNTPTVYTGSTANANFLLGLKATIQAKIACWLVGHVHRDISTVATDGTNNLLVIGFNEDAYEQSAYWGGATMTLGTDTEQAISVIVIDTASKNILIYRCGAGSDRSFNYD